MISQNADRLALAKHTLQVNTRVDTITADMSRLEGLDPVLEEIKQLTKSVELLINCCGISHDGLLASTSLEQVDRIMKTNLYSSIVMTKGLLKPLMRTKGCVINIASVIGPLKQSPGQSIYAASKAGLVGFTKSMAKELGPKKVRVNAILPGFIQTDMTAKLPESLQQTYIQSIPLGRFGQPHDIALACEFLAQSPYITGHCLTVDGGLTL